MASNRFKPMSAPSGKRAMTQARLATLAREERDAGIGLNHPNTPSAKRVHDKTFDDFKSGDRSLRTLRYVKSHHPHLVKAWFNKLIREFVQSYTTSVDPLSPDFCLHVAGCKWGSLDSEDRAILAGTLAKYVTSHYPDKPYNADRVSDWDHPCFPIGMTYKTLGVEHKVVRRAKCVHCNVLDPDAAHVATHFNKCDFCGEDALKGFLHACSTRKCLHCHADVDPLAREKHVCIVELEKCTDCGLQMDLAEFFSHRCKPYDLGAIPPIPTEPLPAPPERKMLDRPVELDARFEEIFGFPASICDKVPTAPPPDDGSEGGYEAAEDPEPKFLFSGSGHDRNYFPSYTPKIPEMPDVPDLPAYTPLPKPPPSFEFPYFIAEDVAQRFKEIGINVISTSSKSHDHPIAAIERMVASRWVYERVYDTDDVTLIGDVGSNIQRVSKDLEKYGLEDHITVHGMMPNFMHGDQMRWSNAQDYPLKCRHELQKCTCGPYDLLLFIHSVYYISPRDLALAISKTNRQYAYVICHNFDNVCGTLCSGEGQYHIGLDGCLHCTFKGNPTYTHVDMWWMKPGQVTWDDITMEWNSIHKIGDTCVYRFELAERRTFRPVSEIEWKSAVDDEKGYIDMTPLVALGNTQLNAPIYEQAISPVTAIHMVYGRTYVATQSGEIIVLPVGLVSTLANVAIASERTPMLYATLAAKARHVLSSLRMPAHIAGPAIIYASVVGMALLLEREAAQIGVMAHYYKDMFEVHKQSLQLEPLQEACCLTRYVFYCCAGWFCCPFNKHEVEEAKQWLHLRNQHISPASSEVIYFRAPANVADIYEPKSRHPILDKLARFIDKGEIVNKPTQPSKLALYGVGFSQVTPTVIERSRRSAILGIKSRVLVETPTPIPQAWEHVSASLDDPRSVLYKLRPLVPALTENLFQKWLVRFPARVQRGLVMARKSLVSTPLEYKDCATEAIVKNEKSKPLYLGHEPIPANTRMVMSMTPRANVATGPYYWLLSAEQKVNFSFKGSYTPIIWTPGHTTEELGEIFDIWCAHYEGNPHNKRVFWFGDQSAMDAHNNECSAAFEMAVYKLAGLPQSFLRANHMTAYPRGKSQRWRGVKYSCKRPRRISGKGNTSMGNFNVNLALIVAILGEPGPFTWSGMFNGDDFLLVTTAGFAERHVIDFDDKLLQLGFECTWQITQNIVDIEFCQMLPYPTTAGTIWGPKIGRILQRLGWSVSEDTLDVFGMVMGLYDTCYHIPYIRQFLDAHRRLTSVSKTVKPWGNLAETRHECTAETLAFVNTRYHLNNMDLEMFSAIMINIRSLPCVVNWPPLLDIALRDE